MKSKLSTLLCIIAFGAAAPAALAAGTPIAAEVEVTAVTTTVEAVDTAKRTVTVMGADGKPVTYKVGKAAQNFAQVKKGDTVKLEVGEAVAVSLVKAKSGTKPDMAALSGAEVAGKGSKPFVEVTETVYLTAKIEHVDAQKRVVTLVGPEGRHVKVKVAKSVGGLEGVKKGDEVMVEYAEVMVFAVVKP